MKKIMLVFLLCARLSCLASQDQEIDPWQRLTKDGKVESAPTSSATAAAAANVSLQPTSPVGFTLGRTSGAVAMSVVTGGFMTAALRLVKDAEGLSAPFSYSLLAGGLLLSLYDTVKRTFGSEYGGIACWGALATTIASGLVLTAIN